MYIKFTCIKCCSKEPFHHSLINEINMFKLITFCYKIRSSLEEFKQ